MTTIGPGVVRMLGFDGVTKRFGLLTALDGCTFAARPGRLTGFLGPNGAGKTTAMRAVFGLVELDGGTVSWHGCPILAADRARFGYMPEERGLYPRMRVRDQLVYLGELCGRAGRDVARGVDAWLERLDLVEDLCQDVVIIDHGRIVLAGDLAGLRAKVPQRFVDIRYRGPAPDWAQLAPLELIESADGQARLRVDCDTALAALVTAVRDRADIVSFAYRPPTLTELFRQAVAA